jgi:branched-chain amino acid transport system substrate-binding protein
MLRRSPVSPRLAFLLALAAALIPAFACGSGARRGGAPEPTPTPERGPIVIAAGQPITIGVSAALSGDQVNLGSDIADAATLAADDFGGNVRGHPIVISRKDDGCTDAQKAVSVARSLIAEDTVAGVIGPMCTTGAQAADSVYDAAEVVHISPSATRVELSAQGERFFFRTSWRDDVQARTQAEYLRTAANAGNVVVIDDAEPYGVALADAFATAFQEAGGTVIGRERFERGDTDFTSLASRISVMNPQAVVYEGLNPEAALLVKALRQALYPGTFVAPDGVFSVRDYLQAAGAATEGSIISGGPVPDAAFVLRFQARFQRVPGTAFVLQAHDAVTALLQAVDASAQVAADGAMTVDRAKLADTLRSRTFSGLTGPISFGANGDRVGETPDELGLVLYRVTDGRFEPVR